MSNMQKRKVKADSDDEVEHPAIRQKTDDDAESTGIGQPKDDGTQDSGAHNNPAANDDDLYAPQHKQIYGDSIFAACEAANATRTRRHKSDEEKRLERLAANRRSARESRNRKKVVFEELQRSVARLAEENAVLRKENTAFRKQMAELKQKYGIMDELVSTDEGAVDPVAGDLEAEDAETESPERLPAIPHQTPEMPLNAAMFQQTPEAPDLNLSSGTSSVVGAADLAGGHGMSRGGQVGHPQLSQNRQAFQSGANAGSARPERKLNYDQLAMLAAAQQQQQFAQAGFPGIPSNLGGGQDMANPNDIAAAQLQQQQQAAAPHLQQPQQKQQQNTQTTQMLLELLKMQHAALLKQQQPQSQGGGGSQV